MTIPKKYEKHIKIPTRKVQKEGDTVTVPLASIPTSIKNPDSGTLFVKPPTISQHIDVILPTHNSMDVDFDKGLGLTISCVRALYRNTLAPFNLIVVDDSTDKLTPLYFRELKKRQKNVTYIHHAPFKEGNEYLNLALSYTKTPYVACIGNSIKVEPDWEVVALNIFKEQKDVGIVGFKNLFPEGALGNTIESAGITIVNYTPVDIGRDLPSHRMTALYGCPAVQWAFCMVRKDAVVDENGVPNLPEGIYNGFKGWDDIDNCFVLRKRGWRVMYNGYGVGYHTPRATRGSSTQVAQKENRSNARIFYKRWGFWDVFTKEYGDDWPESQPDAVKMP